MRSVPHFNILISLLDELGALSLQILHNMLVNHSVSGISTFLNVTMGTVRSTGVFVQTFRFNATAYIEELERVVKPWLERAKLSGHAGLCILSDSPSDPGVLGQEFLRLCYP